MNTFWERLETLLEEQNKTRADLSRAIGIAQSSIMSWKNGSVPSSTAVVKISDYLGVTTDYLLKGEPDAMEDFMRNPKHDIPMEEMEITFKTVLKMLENEGMNIK